MRRLTLLFLAVSFAVAAPVAHAAPVVRGGPTANAAQAPADRDGDGTPDASDRCPDAFGANQGCPQSADRDGDGVLDMDDACPDTYGQQADGCQPFVWRYFCSTQGIKEFAADKPSDTTYCSGLPKCTATHVTFTLSAATAKAAGITKRRISSISVSVPTMGFDHKISPANRRKLARLKKITVTIHASVTLDTGTKLEAADKTLTIYRKHFVAHQFNSNGTDPEGI